MGMHPHFDTGITALHIVLVIIKIFSKIIDIIIVHVIVRKSIGVLGIAWLLYSRA